MARKRTDLSGIIDQFPAVKNLNWFQVFSQDPELYGRVWNDILKFDLSGEGRPGPRPSLATGEARAVAFKRWQQLTEDDYTIEPFVEALKTISHNATIRSIADATGLDRTTVFRLMSGKMEPDSYEMEVCALAYGRRPAYFIEWRIAFILKMLYQHMMKYPESSVGPYRRLRDVVKVKD